MKRFYAGCFSNKGGGPVSVVLGESFFKTHGKLDKAKRTGTVGGGAGRKFREWKAASFLGGPSVSLPIGEKKNKKQFKGGGLGPWGKV